ncbi:hypothetical protein F5148DRAFT_1282035 [Russula earlei]|uniref:Uncharacterized protein n=1 Tax=Russula earlei TaxID=71964 RepID=A0ACC0UFQ0_9AGAM|nr:hypothetical protein F5148DRAFT_1282035 [Russula earlei]
MVHTIFWWPTLHHAFRQVNKPGHQLVLHGDHHARIHLLQVVAVALALALAAGAQDLRKSWQGRDKTPSRILWCTASSQDTQPPLPSSSLLNSIHIVEGWIEA